MKVTLLNDSFPPVIDGVANVVMNYAKKVKKDKGSTILSLREQKQAEKKFGNFYKKDENTNLDTQRILIGYKKIKQFAACYYPDTEIISINPVGLRGLFKDWDQDKGPLENTRQT